ncbi:DUF5110 domain-containing protein [Streptomyces phaeochromogenes]|uniref:glycoside hydrolase family 31 protein n=1 Tax=Streptomyces phaeochromogenes TaxID=1923 RepID=UPI002DDC607D|nr:DUF5110 domain-containing protein [Streptomyces phaeochromogenes]WRZ35458.1 DUF5110 domain-containing protein [Streptomyces phaeochromogenes]
MRQRPALHAAEGHYQFQPIDRLHSTHSDRLPWQHGVAARASADKFLNLRESLVPYTYTLAHQASTIGVPMVRPMYLEYPEEQQAYATADSQYFYGPGMLVVPVTSPGATASVSVRFPPGEWTDDFTGKTYTGPTTRTITTGLNSMPVFVKSGGIVPSRTGKVTNDAQNPLTKVTLTIAQGASGRYDLYEDNGTTTKASDSATTGIRYTENGAGHPLRIGPAAGSFHRQVTHREWTVKVLNARAPKGISVNGEPLGAGAHHWDSTTRTLTVELPRHNIKAPLTLAYH